MWDLGNLRNYNFSTLTSFLLITKHHNHLLQHISREKRSQLDKIFLLNVLNFRSRLASRLMIRKNDLC